MSEQMTRDQLLQLVGSRGITGRDAETAVEHYLAGKRGADTARVERVVEVLGR